MNRFKPESTHDPDVCNLIDSVYAAAAKLKSDSGAVSMPWTQDQVYAAARHYEGACTYHYQRLEGRTYCEYVWWYYTTQ